MKRYPKVEQAKAYRAQVCKMADRYIDDDPKNNAGQLKFFKGLLTGNVAVTVGKEIRKDKRFQDYLCKDILGSNDEVISFFDKEKNLTGFVDLPFWDPPEMYRGFRPKCELPPYLLIQKTLRSIEDKFIDYIGCPLADPDDDTKGSHKKNDVYLELLFGMAFYEICLIEYGEKLSAMRGKENAEYPALDEKTIGKQFPGIFSTDMDSKMRAKDLYALKDAVMEEYDQLRETSMVNSYWTWQTVNLYAMLRLIVLIEYVRINLMKRPDGKRAHADMRAVSEATIWLDLAEAWGDCYLFSSIDWMNHSRMAYGNKLNRIVDQSVILPRIGSDRRVSEVARYFYDNVADMLKYINAVKKHRKDPASRESWHELWKTAVEFAMPVICVTQEIVKIR